MRGGFQPVQRGVASRAEGRVAGLAAEGLDRLGTAMRAISHESVDGSVSDAKVRALLVRPGEALGVDPSGVLPGGFSLHARDAQARALTHY